MRILRILGRVVGALVLLVLLMFTGITGTVYLTQPKDHDQGRIPKLDAAVNVTFDADGIPRIHAATQIDAAAALGYIHARDRMFSMELMRRAASGRLSELLGTATLPTDRFMRTLGLRQAAAMEWAGLPPEPRAMLEAYARGVNAYIADHGRFTAPQFIVYGTPERWTPIDSLLWGKTMALYLSGNWRSELARAALAAQVPPSKINQLWPPQTNVSSAAEAAVDPRYAALAGRLNAILPKFPDSFTLPDTASNEWAVDGKHSVTGAPLLAGDPHLGYSEPGQWYLARIETPDGVLAGATAPGIPFMVIGHNSHVAWTFTTTGADTQDTFQETTLPDGTYDAPGGPEPFLDRREEIGVLFHAPEVLTVRTTRHGPVVSDLINPGGPVYAASIAGLQPDDGAAAGLLALNRATTVAAAGAAAARITSPVQNLLVADAHDIGQFTTGRLPIRKTDDRNGDWPEPGADGAHDWVGWASGNDLPHVVDPPSGRIVNANERVAPPDFPVFMGRDWFGDWRAQRIRALLGDGEHSVADFTAMQVDVVDVFAQGLLPTLRAVPHKDDLAGHAAGLLDIWNGAMTMDAPQPLIFNAWMRRFEDDVLTRNGIPTGAARPSAEFIAWVLSPAGASWCGTPCSPVLDTALHEAVTELAAQYGQDSAAWRWGTAHVATFADAVIPPLSVHIPQPGDATTIFVGGMRANNFDAVHGPGYRGVYDLADLDRSVMMTAPGQSGRPFNRHAYDLLQRWRDGVGITLGPNPGQIEATLHLVPSRGDRG
jgi:penicillin G amidase